MHMNKNKQYIMTEEDLVHGVLTGKQFDTVIMDDIEPINTYNEWCQTFDLDRIISASYENNSDTYVEECLNKREGPVIAASDYMRSFADQIRPYTSKAFYSFGTDGYGRSDSRKIDFYF